MGLGLVVDVVVVVVVVLVVVVDVVVDVVEFASCVVRPPSSVTGVVMSGRVTPSSSATLPLFDENCDVSCVCADAVSNSVKIVIKPEN